MAYNLLMDESAFHPEDRARSLIDRRLAACGWLVQSRAEMNLGAGCGVAVREFQTASGPVDYGLFVGRKLCGVIEAKPQGTTLSGFSEQAARYIADVPEHLVREEGRCGSNMSRPAPRRCFATTPTPIQCHAASSPSIARKRWNAGSRSR